MTNLNLSRDNAWRFRAPSVIPGFGIAAAFAVGFFVLPANINHPAEKNIFGEKIRCAVFMRA